MIDFLESVDHSLIQTINGCNSERMDQFMWFFRSPFIVIPIVLLISWTMYKSYSLKESGWILFGIIITIALADLSSVYLFKEVFMRYRPSHHIELSQQLHFINLIRGLYKEENMDLSPLMQYFALLVLVYGLISKILDEDFTCINYNYHIVQSCLFGSSLCI